jgi:low temperature requirement protein LtrA
MEVPANIRKATWLELFFDLIFVVAISKTAHVLTHVHDGHLSTEMYVKYILILVPVFWAWVGHTMFANRFDCEDPLQKIMTLAQMFCAIVMSSFITVDFDAGYKGFLLSYMALRGLTLLMYMRAVYFHPETWGIVRNLVLAFFLGGCITASSLLFEGIERYTVLYLGILLEIIVPIVNRRRLAALPVNSHHLPERFGLMVIILLGESILSLVQSYEDIEIVTPEAFVAGASGFVLAVCLWWIYFDNLEHHITGKELGHGQTISYPHFLIYAGLGGIAAMIRFAIIPELTLMDYKIVSLFGIFLFMFTEQFLCFIYHPRCYRRALVIKSWLFNVLFLLLVCFAQSTMTILIGTTILLIGYAVLTHVKVDETETA